jgi:centromeric protein E
MEKICVAIRVRPPTRQNSVRGYHWKVLDNSISLLSGAGTVISGHTFAFGAFPSYSNLSRSIRQK